jgi:hypothetical protein
MTKTIKSPKRKSEIIKEHAAVLLERRAAMSAPDAQFLLGKKRKRF